MALIGSPARACLRQRRGQTRGPYEASGLVFPSRLSLPYVCLSVCLSVYPKLASTEQRQMNPFSCCHSRHTVSSCSSSLHPLLCP